MSNEYLIVFQATPWVIKLLSEAYSLKFPDKAHTLTIEDNNKICRIICPLNLKEFQSWIAATPYGPQNCFQWDGYSWQKVDTAVLCEKYPGERVEKAFGPDAIVWQVGFQDGSYNSGYFPALKASADSNTANALFERFAFSSFADLEYAQLNDEPA